MTRALRRLLLGGLLSVSVMVEALPASAQGRPGARRSRGGAAVQVSRRPNLTMSYQRAWSQARHQAARRPDATVVPPPVWRRSLNRVRRALAPLCTPHCGRVVLKVDRRINSAASAQPGRYRTIVRVHPEKAETWSRTYRDAYALYVMAHEYGHHLDFLHPSRPTSGGDKWKAELVAETIAGCALSRLGSDWRGITRRLAVVERYLSHTPGFDHPPPGLWVPALRHGYVSCQRYPHIKLKALLSRTRKSWNVARPGPRREYLQR